MIRRNTVQKMKILSNLQKRCDHPTAQDIHSSLRSDLPQISLATVYRNLDDLSDHGKIRKLTFAGETTRYDGELSKHDHIYCTECGAVEDIDPVRLKRPLIEAKEKSQFTIKNIELILTGLCPNCK